MKNNHLLYMNFDAFADYYYSGCENRFPHLKALVEQSLYFSSCYSCIPSITVPMQTAIVSGCKSKETGNCYQYFDKSKCEIIKTGRDNKAQTVAELYKELDLKVLSIQQFAVENHGCTKDDVDHLYIQPGGDFNCRFDILINYINTKKIGDIQFVNYHDAILFYIDDLDSVGHNHTAPFALSEEERVERVRTTLEAIDKRIGELIASLKENGLWENTTILLTADHGMVGFEGESKLIELCDSIHIATGLKVTFDEKRAKNADIFITSNSIQAQVYFLNDGVNQKRLKEKLLELDYVERIMTSEELRFADVDERYADMLISPKENYAFYIPRDESGNIRFASHDSLNEKAQHVFALIHHPFMDGKIIEKKCEITSLMPLCLKLLGHPKLKNSKDENEYEQSR